MKVEITQINIRWKPSKPWPGMRFANPKGSVECTLTPTEEGWYELTIDQWHQGAKDAMVEDLPLINQELKLDIRLRF